MKNLLRFTLLLAFILTFTLNLFGQNIVLNPSFEDTATLGTTMFYRITKNWYNPNNASADYFSPFCTLLGWGCCNNAPNIWFGYEPAQDGNAYIALDIYENSSGTGKEYAQGFLSQPMTSGEKYYVSMYLKLVNASIYKICNIDFAFSNTLIYSNQGYPFNFTDTVSFNISDVDTSDWKYVHRTYVAHGGERYIYIGNNTPNFQIICVDTLQGVFPFLPEAYYFIDNVYVSENPVFIDEYSDHGLRILPNPAQYEIQVLDIGNVKAFEILNLSGTICKKGILKSDSKTINISELPNGFYFIKIDSQMTKLIINH